MLEPPTQRLDIVFQAGDDRPAVIPVVDAAGHARDVTGWTVLAVVRRDPGGPVLHQWSTTDGSARCGPQGVTLLTDDSDEWTWERGRYDVRATAPSGAREVVAFGTAIVRPLRSRP